MEKALGFSINEDIISFNSSKKTSVNYDWSIDIKNITGVALGNKMRFDDDSSFLVLMTSNQEPVYINLTYASEEMKNFENFLQLLKDKLGIEGDIPSLYKEDDVVLIYPSRLSGEQLYEKWNSSLEAIISSIKKTLGINHTISGVIRKELKEKLS